MAINFPATGGQPTDGTFTHTAAGITWEWDGTSWKARGSADAYQLPIAGATTLGGIKVGNNLSITSGGVLSATASATDLDSLTDVTLTSPSNGQVLSYNGSAWVNAAATGGGGGATVLDDLTDTVVSNPDNTHVLRYDGSQWINGVVQKIDAAAVTQPAAAHRVAFTADGIGAQTIFNDTAFLYYPQSGLIDGPSNVLQSRGTVAHTVTGAVDGVANSFTVSAAPTYALLKIETNIAAWVTLYVDAASRTADAARVETADPTPGSGVIAEVITSGATTQLITPGTIGFNNDSPVASTVYIKAVNKSGSTNDLTVTLTYVKLEA